MKAFDCYCLLITPLAPVHIGTGESYEPTNYVIEDGVLYEFDTGSVVEALSAADRKALLDISNRKPNTDMIQAVQRFFFERREVLMAHAVQRIPVLAGVANLYTRRVGQTANLETDGKKVVNRLEIDRTAFDPITRRPVLYGSSLKGAIRTALLDSVNRGKPAQEQKGLHEFQGRIFEYLNDRRKPVLELDPMRLVQIADATWGGEEGLPAAAIHLAVNRKKAPVRDDKGRLRKSQAEAKELYQILECVPGMQYRAFISQLNLQSVAAIEEQDRQGKRQLPDKNLRFDAGRIARACNAFYLPLLRAENKVLAEREYLDPSWQRTIENLLAQAKDKMDKGEVFLLRAGRHSGAESVTLNGVRSIKILEGKGEDGRQRSSNASSAKTLWLAAEEKDQTTGMLPFGWLLVELIPYDAPMPEWADLRHLCEPHLVVARAFAGRLARQRERVEQAQRAAEAKRHEEEERRRQEVEKTERQAREEAERQARLATLTANLRRVEQFKEEMAKRAQQLRGGKDRPNTLYHDKARQLARAALEGEDWTPEERTEVAQAIEEWLPKVVAVEWKEERKKLKIAQLMGNA